MFQSLLLPIFLTLIALWVYYPLIGKTKLARWAGTIALLACVPTCALLSLTTNILRFREHHFDHAADISLVMVRDSVPASATNIELHLTSSGYWAKFTIQQNQLDAWFVQQRLLFKNRTDCAWAGPYTRAVSPDIPGDFNRFFARFGWLYSGVVTHYDGPQFPNGSGSHLFYNPATDEAFQYYAFW